ncbi:protein trichome birefringence-like 14 isoform X1 [Panicum miliaceum]|uniref:Protein trichome birefringence-like 14 isoform X1 n=1 Tax=Panicum miliaceum TaxID=4540 RepID=A0A3L6RJZ7_PANMI|nr:protein trichome birefringence-like 14 isoform X1 [Panicum miliaceum]
MSHGFINGLRFKHLKLVTLAFFMLFLLWKWGKGTYYGSGVLQSDPLFLTDPADSKFVDQRTTSEADFPSVDPFPQSIVKVEKQVTGAPPPLTIGYSVDIADENEVPPPDKKDGSQMPVRCQSLRMQDKTIAYVGDSLGRQMFESMMCMVTGGK